MSIRTVGILGNDISGSEIASFLSQKMNLSPTLNPVSDEYQNIDFDYEGERRLLAVIPACDDIEDWTFLPPGTEAVTVIKLGHDKQSVAIIKAILLEFGGFIIERDIDGVARQIENQIDYTGQHVTFTNGTAGLVMSHANGILSVKTAEKKVSYQHERDILSAEQLPPLETSPTMKVRDFRTKQEYQAILGILNDHVFYMMVKNEEGRLSGFPLDQPNFLHQLRTGHLEVLN